MADELERQIERQKWLHELKREDAHRDHDANKDFLNHQNEATVKSADSALRALILINGGAAVSVLAFVGGLVSQDRLKINQITDVTSSLLLFAYGVVAAVAAMGLTYAVNFVNAWHAHSLVLNWEHPFVSDGKHSRKLKITKNALHALAFGVACSSLVFFVYGMWDIKRSIDRFSVPQAAPVAAETVPVEKAAPAP